MNLKRFIAVAICSISVVTAFACGAFNPITSKPFSFHFYQGEDTPTIITDQRNENISLWQSMTSREITRLDIEEAVYEMSLSQLQDAFETSKTKNSFLQWIIKSKATELKDFLLLAKEVEELRLNRASKWYYPIDKKERYDSRSESERFENIIDRCKNHTKGPLADRYGLQYVRVLLTLGKNKECIDFFNGHMAKLPDNNLFKKMAKGYIAGCLKKTGAIKKANSMFAEIGDFNSISGNKSDYFKTLVNNNPESDVIKSRLNNWIGYGEDKDNLPFLDVADAALNSPKIVNKGDWLYLKAFIEETYNGNHAKALKYARQSLSNTFSKEEMRHDAKTMELCLSAEQGSAGSGLLNDVETFQDNSVPYYFYIVPSLLKSGRKSEALLMANYASAIERKDMPAEYYSYRNGSQTVYPIFNDTYANTGFQLMLSMSTQDVINYKEFLKTGSPLVKKCKDSVRHDDDYLNEIIGTLFLREGNYDKAYEYLSKVSPEYQKELNVYQTGYLNDNPWFNCYMPEDKWDYPSRKGEEQDIEPLCNPENSSLLLSPDNAKLNFSKEMVKLRHLIATGSPDESGMARIRYALARYNSFVSCWALTQYWQGDANQCNYQPYHWLWNGPFRELDYLKELTGDIPDEKWLETEIIKGFNQIKSPEIKAEAEYLLGNYKTIAKQYPSSAVGKFLAAHCDSWADWL